MGETETPVPGRWHRLQERVQPLDADVGAALDEPVPEPVETPVDLPEHWDRLRRLVGPPDGDFIRAGG